jgi:hypothetical protein
LALELDFDLSELAMDEPDASLSNDNISEDEKTLTRAPATLTPMQPSSDSTHLTLMNQRMMVLTTKRAKVPLSGKPVGLESVSSDHLVPVVEYRGS